MLAVAVPQDDLPQDASQLGADPTPIGFTGIASQKGGAATTTATDLGVWLAHSGLRVRLLDMDVRGRAFLVMTAMTARPSRGTLGLSGRKSKDSGPMGLRNTESRDFSPTNCSTLPDMPGGAGNAPKCTIRSQGRSMGECRKRATRESPFAKRPLGRPGPPPPTCE